MSGDEGRAIGKTVRFADKMISGGCFFREMSRAQTHITVTALTFSANARQIFRKPIECLSGYATKPLLSKIKETDRVTTCVKLKKNRAIMFLTNSRTHFTENDRRHAHQTRFEEKPSGIVLHIDIKSDRSLNAARQRDRWETAFCQVAAHMVRIDCRIITVNSSIINGAKTLKAIYQITTQTTSTAFSIANHADKRSK